MDARGALAVAALLLLTACASATEPASSTPAASTDAGPAASAAATPDPLAVEPLSPFEPAEPVGSLPCMADGVDYLVSADDPRAFALRFDADTAADAPAVVLGHQSDGYPCQWAAEATLLAERGYRVLVPSLQHGEPLAAMLAAEQLARADGAATVVLAGASMGGMLAIAAAAVVDEPPAAVIALAPPVAYRGFDLHDFAPHLDAPVLLAVGMGDGDLPDQAAEIAALLPAEPQLVEIDTYEHGVLLLDHAAGREAFDAVLAEHAPAG